MHEVVLATRNVHKFREVRVILSHLPLRFLWLADFPGCPDAVEDGKTFQENALKKAQFYAETLGKKCLADDSGLEVDFLQGAPGVYSARFSGPGATDDDNNRKLMTLLNAIAQERRTARYRCVMAVASPEGPARTAEGTCEGWIALEPSGRNGFGYDPLFFYPPFGKTFGETEPHLKNTVSHRYHALMNIAPALMEMAP